MNAHMCIFILYIDFSYVSRHYEKILSIRLKSFLRANCKRHFALRYTLHHGVL